MPTPAQHRKRKRETRSEERCVALKEQDCAMLMQNFGSLPVTVAKSLFLHMCKNANLSRAERRGRSSSQK